ncbi:MAG: DUF3302 domain-containing protein [Albimonas sp.]|uniref:DUF3302 domain-containing protein n=1 Tax=Albimonas sp. TaxID=1872425 RepID=UPI0040579D98
MNREPPPAGAGLLPGNLDSYDYLTVLVVVVALVAIFAVVLWVLGLPGRIAIQRGHPHATSVNLMGWAGALAVIPWIHAFMWAYHDSLTVDIRRFPDEERKAIEEEIAHLKAAKSKKAGDPPAEG